MANKRNYVVNCHECGNAFKALRPVDKYCSSACRWKARDKQDWRIAEKKIQNVKWRSWNFDYRRDYMLRYAYGIDQQKYEELLAAQGGCCAICGKTPEEEGRNLAVDHDHKTGEIFGILCAMCNKILVGKIRHPTAFERAAKYLEKGTGLFVPEKKKRKKRGKTARSKNPSNRHGDATSAGVCMGTVGSEHRIEPTS